MLEGAQTQLEVMKNAEHRALKEMTEMRQQSTRQQTETDEIRKQFELHKVWFFIRRLLTVRSLPI
jgi:hypothetical protein